MMIPQSNWYLKSALLMLLVCASAATAECPAAPENPANGALICLYQLGPGGACSIQCNPGTAFVASESVYIACSAETGFQWIHQNLNLTAGLPRCNEEYFADTEMSIAFAYTSTMTCTAVSGTIRSLVEDLNTPVSGMEACGERCTVSDMHLECVDETEDSTSRLYVSFKMQVQNIKTAPVGPNCDQLCQHTNRRLSKMNATRMRPDIQGHVAGLADNTPVTMDPSSFTVTAVGITCQTPGRVLTNDARCVPCFKGSYLAKPSDSYCKLCPVGAYQAEESQTICVQCPQGFTTSTTGSSEASMCHVQTTTTTSAATTNG